MITDYEEDVCDEALPEGIWITRGFGTANCRYCNFRSAYWECACDLEHDCNEEG